MPTTLFTQQSLQLLIEPWLETLELSLVPMSKLTAEQRTQVSELLDTLQNPQKTIAETAIWQSLASCSEVLSDRESSDLQKDNFSSDMLEQLLAGVVNLLNVFILSGVDTSIRMTDLTPKQSETIQRLSKCWSDTIVAFSSSPATTSQSDLDRDLWA